MNMLFCFLKLLDFYILSVVLSPKPISTCRIVLTAVTVMAAHFLSAFVHQEAL